MKKILIPVACVAFIGGCSTLNLRITVPEGYLVTITETVTVNEPVHLPEHDIGSGSDWDGPSYSSPDSPADNSGDDTSDDEEKSGRGHAYGKGRDRGLHRGWDKK